MVPTTTKAEAPGPGAREALRIILRWSRDQVRPVEALARQYGGIALVRVGTLRFYFVQAPELVERCLVTDHKRYGKDRFFARFVRLILGNGILTVEGPSHLRQRRMLQPAFHQERIKAYSEAMADAARRRVDLWQPDQQVDLAKEMQEITLDIVGRTLFDCEVSADARTVAAAIETILDRGDLFLIPLFPWITQLPGKQNRRFRQAIADLDGVLFRLIEERRREGLRGDLLSMVLAARDEGDDAPLSERQVRDEALTLFTSGHETTSMALTWTCHLLAAHPEVQQRVQAEVDAVLEGRTPTAEDYPRLEYTRRVFQEALRLYPPTIMVGREAREDTELGGYRIPRGSIVVMTPYVTHRDPALYPEPERFDPDRWLPHRAATRHRFAYFPFGGGQRRCIGEGFAWMEGIIILATMAQRWTLEADPAHEVNIRPRLTMHPLGGLPMYLRIRENRRAPIGAGCSAIA